MRERSGPSEPALSLRGVTYGYSGVPPVLRAVGLDVVPGEVAGIMGPNGSGKTTLLRVAAGLLRPAAGEVRVLPGRGDDRGSRARRTAVVLDRIPFADPLAGRENLRLLLALRRPSSEGRRSAADPAATRDDVEAALTAFGLADEAGRPLASWSHGMRRRLALAEAFAATPDLLLLDEPTLGLDPLGLEALRRALGAAARRGAAALVCTNDPAFAASACGRVLFLHGGRILADGAPEDLVRRLGGETVIRVEGRPPGPGFVPPRGVRSLDGPDGGSGPGARPRPSARGTARFAAAAGAAVLPELCARWLAAGGEPRSLRVREPDLADVFLSLAGVPLHSDAADRDGADVSGEGSR